MKKISLAIISCFFHLFSAFAQTPVDDSIAFKPRKLKLEEVNFVSGYYRQDGNHSAVTGGNGTEQLTDFANTLEVIVLKPGKDHQYRWSAEIGIDHYTSASSDNIDPHTISGPSSNDTRIYPSLSWSEANNKGNTFGLTGSFSTEFDYKSIGIGANYIKSSKDNNREFSVHAQAYFDRWTVIYPEELRPAGGAFSGHSGDYSPRNSYSANLAYAQVINKRLQIAVLADIIYQQGLLATDYQRVYFSDLSERIENLPGSRLKLPLGIRASYFSGDRIILRAWYRYYTDDWGITANTFNLEVPVKITSFLSISPFYRFYQQNAARYFQPWRTHLVSDNFYTSDYDLAAFTSQFFGAGLRWAPGNGVLGVKQWHSVEVRYGHYLKSTGLSSDILTLAASFK